MHYTKAIENLGEFYKVICFDKFNTESVDFSNGHDILFNDISNERKATYQRPDLEEINLIKQFNQLDMRLYNQWSREMNSNKTMSND